MTDIEYWGSMKTHLVNFSNNSVAIDYDGVAAQSVVDFLFSDLDGNTEKRQDEKPLSRMTISYTRERGFRLDQSQKTLYRGRNKASLALALE